MDSQSSFQEVLARLDSALAAAFEARTKRMVGATLMVAGIGGQKLHFQGLGEFAPTLKELEAAIADYREAEKREREAVVLRVFDCPTCGPVKISVPKWQAGDHEPTCRKCEKKIPISNPQAP